MHGDVLCLSHLRWGFVYQRPHHLMSRFARDSRVFFVEEPIFDADVAHLVMHEVEPHLTLAVPHLPPDQPPDVVIASQRALLDQLVAQRHISRPLLWFYTPMALTFAGHLEGAVTVYDAMDELSGFDGAPPELRARERELFSRADVVFTGGHSLYEAKKSAHPRVYPFPSSVDAAHFARARSGGLAEPADQASIPHPRLGFFGVVDERMDLRLLAQVADAHTWWDVVVVGPVVKIDPAFIPVRPNLRFLGAKKYDELPAYLAGWDVALMPFAQNDATRFISPTKTLEYLAAGKPVVSTPIRDVVRPYGEQGLVRIGEGRAFVAAVEEAIAERDKPEEAARREAADQLVAQTSWDRTFSQMVELIREATARRARTSEVKGAGMEAAT